MFVHGPRIQRFKSGTLLGSVQGSSVHLCGMASGRAGLHTELVVEHRPLASNETVNDPTSDSGVVSFGPHQAASRSKAISSTALTI